MKSKKLRLISLIAAGIVGLIFFQAAAPTDGGGDEGNGNSRDWVQQPPEADSFWVQKLETALEDGSNMIMRIKYIPDSTLPSVIKMYPESDTFISFRDDGYAPDLVAGDFIYAAYVQEDISAFLSNLTAMENNLSGKGSMILFSGHNGQEVTDLPIFDAGTFAAGGNTPLAASLLNGIDCITDANSMKRQNSLFITDLSVVEDPARTFNITDSSGNWQGIWTFATLIKNMSAPASVSPRAFLKSWIKHFVQKDTVNGQVIEARSAVLEFLIVPWLHKVNHSVLGSVTSSNWTTYWDAENSDSLLKYAPFKLTAIVNRLDLRGNPAYKSSSGNAGETRFIFTLVDPVTGLPPVNGNSNFSAGGNSNFADWSGLNVIFEYGNVETNVCRLREYAQRWFDLSYYSSFPNSAFNDSLEAITRTVIDANTNLSNPNYSAISRIRTNERIFFPSSNVVATWKASDWELRQFEIDPGTHLLAQVGCTNTPVGDANATDGFGVDVIQNVTQPASAYLAQKLRDSLINWVFNPINKSNILHESHLIPLLFPGSATPMLAGSAIVAMDYVHFWDLYWYVNTPNYSYSALLPTTTLHPVEKEVRQKFSLNTCQGCHAGETKTIFTHIRPLGYGQSANYWGSVPDYLHDDSPANMQPVHLDAGRYPPSRGSFVSNNGFTRFQNTVMPNNNPDSAALNRYFVNVSPFLTGRNYSGRQGRANWNDDNPADDSMSNKSLDGLFYVADPSNRYTGTYNGASIPYNGGYTTFPKPDTAWGYNDLLRRKNDLCKLVNLSCNRFGVVLNLVFQAKHHPYCVGCH